MWKEKTCEKCKYRVDNECRRFPPSIFTVITGIDSGTEVDAYPQVKYIDGFTDACAEYAEDGQISGPVNEAVLAFFNRPVTEFFGVVKEKKVSG